MPHGSTLFNRQQPALPHLVQQGGGLSGEIADLRKDLKTILNRLAPIGVSEFTNPATASTTAIKTAAATVASVQSFSGATLNGSTGANAMPGGIARNVSITTAGVTPADVPATATITGLYLGKAQTETINVGQTATTVFGTKPFDKVTQIDLPAADGTAATLAFGFGPALGVGLPVKSRASGVVIIREVVDGALVTTGALTSNNLYTPATAPDGAHDYAVYYEFDPASTLLAE